MDKLIPIVTYEGDARKITFKRGDERVGEIIYLSQEEFEALTNLFK